MESATQIFEALADRYRWTLLTNRDSGFAQRWRASGADVQLVPLDNSRIALARAWERLRWTVQVAGEVAVSRPALIHVNDIRAYQALRIAASLRREGRLLFTIRDTKAEDEQYGQHWHRAARQCTRLIVLSGEMREVICHRLGVAAERLQTVNSIVDLERFCPLAKNKRVAQREHLGIAPGEFALGVVGAVHEKKDQLAFIERALPSLLNSESSIRVHFLGDFAPERNPYARRCLDSVHRLGIADRVRFHGHTDNIAEWYPSLDCVVVASRREGLARCMIEAMSCGTPIASFAVCSAREMLEATGAGVVVPLGDHEALTSAVVALVRDRAKADAMGRSGRSTALRRFDKAIIAAEFSRIYDEVMNDA